jgi:hypothetical protein
MTDCVPFHGGTGYGYTSMNGVSVLAHRAAWIKANGPIPPGMVVRHSCDNPPCINVEHLRLGTQADNMADAKERGRVHRPFGHKRTVGSKHGMAKLTEADVVIIKKLLGTQSQRSIAARFGVNQATISMVATGKRWSHVQVTP